VSLAHITSLASLIRRLLDSFPVAREAFFETLEQQVVSEVPGTRLLTPDEEAKMEACFEEEFLSVHPNWQRDAVQDWMETTIKSRCDKTGGDYSCLLRGMSDTATKVWHTVYGISYGFEEPYLSWVSLAWESWRARKGEVAHRKGMLTALDACIEREMQKPRDKRSHRYASMSEPPCGTSTYQREWSAKIARFVASRGRYPRAKF
jgi:hypothetical protein